MPQNLPHPASSPFTPLNLLTPSSSPAPLQTLIVDEGAYTHPELEMEPKSIVNRVLSRQDHADAPREGPHALPPEVPTV